jgi:large subunit ribosomal protein L18
MLNAETAFNIFYNNLTPGSSCLYGGKPVKTDKMALDQKVIRRQKLRWRIRTRVRGTAQRPRLSVFRSNRDIYVQLIDDTNGTTLAAASSRMKGITATPGNKVAQSMEVGRALAQKAKDLGIETCVFDRGGYLYHGRVKAVADGAREGGLKF